MSDNLEQKLQKLTNKELIDFALEHLGSENEAIRTAALQEHFERIKDAPSTTIAPVGDVKLLHSKLLKLTSQTMKV